MFSDCFVLQTIDLSHFNTDNVIDMGWMFDGCNNLKMLNLSSFNMNKVTEQIGMLKGCTSLKTLPCRTQADADKMKNDKYTPTTINFIVKQ